MAKIKTIIITGLTSLAMLLFMLSQIQGVTITTSGDILCMGNSLEPCVSYFNITSSNYSIKIVNETGNLYFNTTDANYTLYKYSSGKWVKTSIITSLTKGVLYQYKLVGYKSNSAETIKWGIVAGDANADPLWNGVTPINILPSINGCTRSGYCETIIDLKDYFPANAASNIKALNLTTFLPKTAAKSALSGIVNVNYKLNGTNLTIFGNIYLGSSTYWTMNLSDYGVIDPYWNSSDVYSETATQPYFFGMKINTTNGTINVTRVSVGATCNGNNVTIVRVSDKVIMGTTTTKGGTWFNFSPPVTLDGPNILYYIATGNTDHSSHTVCYDASPTATPIQTENFKLESWVSNYPDYNFVAWIDPRTEAYEVNGTETNLIGSDTTPPTYNNNGTNNSNPAPLSQVLHYTNWTDNTGLSHWIFSWNATGATCSDGFSNDTAVAFSGNPAWSNVTKQVPLACANKTIDFLFYANDTSNNWNKTTDMFENETSVLSSAVHLYLNGTENNNTYTYGQVINATGWVSTPNDGIGNLYRNGTPVGTGTTITTILNDTNTGNVADSFVAENNPTLNYGTSQILYTDAYQSPYGRGVYIIWNLSSLPVGAIIINVNFSMYLFSQDDTNPAVFAVWNTTLNQSNSSQVPWNETNLAWNSKPVSDKLQDTQSYSSLNKWYYFNVTNATISSFAISNNMSLYLDNLTFSSGQSTSQKLWVSKENTTDISKRPQLIITYNLTGSGNIVQSSDSSLSVGVWNYSFNYLGNATYNSSLIWYFVNITQAPSNMSLYINGTQANWNSNYPNSTLNVTAVVNISSLPITLMRNETILCYGIGSCSSIIKYGVGEYNFTANYTSNASMNYSSSNATWNATIGKGTSNVTILINGTNANYNMYFDESANITAFTNVTEGLGLVKLSMNATDYGTNWTSGALKVTNYTTTLSKAVYMINATYDGDANWSNSIASSLYLTVTNLSISLELPPSTTNWLLNATSCTPLTGCYQTGNFTPQNQTLTQWFWRINNTGESITNVTFGWNNTLHACMDFYIANSSSYLFQPTNGYNIDGTTPVIVKYNLAVGGTISFWSWIVFNSCPVNTSIPLTYYFTAT